MLYPFLTVGIVVKNQEKYIAETIENVLNNDYPKKKYELIVVDGNSIDRTQEIVKRLMEKHQNIKLIVEPWEKGTSGMARNLVIQEAKGEFIVFTDGDCVVPRNWIKDLVVCLTENHRDNKKVVAVGGIRKPCSTKNWKEDLLNQVISTFWGSGGSQGFVSTKNKYTDSIPTYNAIYLTNVLKKEQFCDIPLGDDYELNSRLIAKGYQIAFDRKVMITHHQEGDLTTFLKQMFLYGKAQALIYQRIKKMRYFAFIAPLFVLGLLVGLILSFFNNFFLLIYSGILSFYLLLSLYYTLNLFFKTRKNYICLAFIIFPLQHISYGIGVIAGFLQSKK